MLRFLVILCLCFGQYLCDYQSDCLQRKEEPYDDLVVTWAPPNANNPLAFSHLPRTTKDAEAQKWVKVDDGCSNSSLKHKGQRYMLGDDLSVLTIYDKNGFIAGLLRTIPKELADEGGVVDFENLEYTYQDTIKGQERYVFAVYFIDPKIICSTGRTSKQFQAQGTMSGVYIKNGPESYLQPPNDQNEAVLKSQKWTKGFCVESMGHHYYLEAYKNQSCTNQRPWFLTYDCGRLVCVGLFVIGNFTQEPRYEYVPQDTLPIFIDPVPDCIEKVYGPETYGITALHMFFDKEPRKITCPKTSA